MARPRTFSDEDILATARRLWLEGGPGVSTRDIAVAMGMSQPALLKRFGTRENLMIQAMLPRMEDDFVSRLPAADDPRPFADQLREVVHLAEAFLNEAMPRIALLKMAGMIGPNATCTAVGPDHPLRRAPFERSARVAAWIRGLMNRGVLRQADAEGMASALMGTLHGRVMFKQNFGQTPTSHSTEEWAEVIVDLFAHSLMQHPLEKP
jgi:AcrR family transcriptional regulator